MYNPYPFNNFSSQPFVPTFPTDDKIPRVNGENGARALELRPNGEKIALDINEPLLWLITADSAGYKTISAFDIKPHKADAVPMTDYSELEKRIKKIEEKIYESDSTDTATNE